MRHWMEGEEFDVRAESAPDDEELLEKGLVWLK